MNYLKKKISFQKNLKNYELIDQRRDMTVTISDLSNEYF